MSIVEEIGDSDFDARVRGVEGLVVIDFTAQWCGSCKRLLPELEAAAGVLSDQASFYKVDVDAAPTVAMRYGVQSIPNLTFLKSGEVVDTVIGGISRASIV